MIAWHARRIKMVLNTCTDDGLRQRHSVSIRLFGGAPFFKVLPFGAPLMAQPLDTADDSGSMMLAFVETTVKASIAPRPSRN
jgi:hypothetical protein